MGEGLDHLIVKENDLPSSLRHARFLYRPRLCLVHLRTLDPASARYDFRVFLLRLGFIGEEFKTARKHLLERMTGDAAFKRGRPIPKPKESGGGDGKADATLTNGTTSGAGLDVRPYDFQEIGSRDVGSQEVDTP